jgi:hypothetical protein
LAKERRWDRYFHQIVDDLLGRCDKKELELFGIVARNIWFQRNNVIHGGAFDHPNVLVCRATMDLEEFQQANSKHEETAWLVLFEETLNCIHLPLTR